MLNISNAGISNVLIVYILKLKKKKISWNSRTGIVAVEFKCLTLKDPDRAWAYPIVAVTARYLLLLLLLLILLLLLFVI